MRVWALVFVYLHACHGVLRHLLQDFAIGLARRELFDLTHDLVRGCGGWDRRIQLIGHGFGHRARIGVEHLSSCKQFVSQQSFVQSLVVNLAVHMYIMSTFFLPCWLCI